MRKLRINQFLLVALSVLFLAVVLGAAETEKSHLRAKLDGIHETNPSTIITNGTGTLTATVNDDATITYTLTYSNLSTPVTQAHIHIGATKITGGISIFFCTNLGNGPAGTPACPNDATNSGTVTHTVTAADVVGPAGQGVAVGDMTSVVRAIASGVTYANVHTTAHPAGEIRGQIRQRDDDPDDLLPGADHHHD
ncbi:MAG TPA: CHRD domain-containing protein [Candidatus Angelobacter sp.]|nr:CHRD domain-containing protein [Candidatus Angelobacter sp.]